MAATIDADTRRKANLRVLQRIDCNIVDLAITATHVVLYEYSKNNCWEKMNVEGTLFVTKRSDVPRFKLIVLNRSSTENVEVPITASFQMQVKDPYLIFRESAQSSDFRGFWFHDGEERDRIASHLEQVVKSLVQLEEMEKKNPSSFTQPSLGGGGGGDAEAVRRDAGAALLSTLNLGAKEDSAKSEQNRTFPRPLPAETPPRAAATTTTAAAMVATTTPAGMTPISSVTHTIGGSSHSSLHPSSTQTLVLDKKNLQLTLLSLLHDDRFLDLIHAQYLKVVHRRQAPSTPREKEEGDGGNGNGSGGK
jgi:mRNA-decapping enzyme 1B